MSEIVELPDKQKFYLPSKFGQKYVSGIYSPEGTNYYEKFYELKRGMVAVDAGAYAGLWTIKASKLVGEKGKVISIEPWLPIYKVLLKNIEINKLKNVIPINEGLWNREGVAYLKYGGRNVGGRDSQTTDILNLRIPIIGHILQRLPQPICARILAIMGYSRTKVTTLQRIIERFSVEKIDFLKMNIEGAELRALEGFSVPRGMTIVTETHNDLDAYLQILKNEGIKEKDIFVQYNPRARARAVVYARKN